MSISGSAVSQHIPFEWWTWILSIANTSIPGNNPARGGNIFQNQDLGYFCQVCTMQTGSDLRREYTNQVGVNENKNILVPVLTSEASIAEYPNSTDEDLLALASYNLRNPSMLFLHVAGPSESKYVLTLKNADDYYVESAADYVTPANDNVLGMPAVETRMRCVGYFVELDKLVAHGPALDQRQYTITFGGSAGPSGDLIQTLVSYRVTVPWTGP